MVGSDGERPNVLLVVLDSVRAQNCSTYGARRETTPFLSSLAERATLYTNARAPSNWSLPSHVSIFTGLETHVHGVTVHDRLDPGRTVFEELAAAGYETGLFTENGFVAAHDVGLKSAFETVVTVPDADDPAAEDYRTGAVNTGPDGFYYADALLEWTAERDGPWAACLNLMDAHRPFEPRRTYDHWGDQEARELQADLGVRWEWTFHGGERPMWQLAGLESLYDGAIRQADAVVECVVDTLCARGDYGGTSLIVCADHGDGFGEPGLLDGEPPAVSHIVPMHEQLLHVPLVAKAPGQTEGRVVDEPAALTRFPAVARAHVAGRDADRGFVPDGPVVASKQPVTGDLRERFVDACGDVAPFAAPSRAVYAAGRAGSVRKHYHWGDECASVRVHAPGAAVHEDRGDPSRIDAAFGAFEPADVRSPHEDPDAVTEEVEARLAALGYY